MDTRPESTGPDDLGPDAKGLDELTRLLLAAQSGDRLALAGFVRTSQGEVWRLVAHLVGAGEADDVTQDVYLRAWRAVPAFRGEASARTWLLAIARRACADELRRRVRRRRLGDRLTRETGRALSTSDGAPDVAPDVASVQATTALVAQLTPDRREAFVLTQVLGCSYEEAATICNVPTGTIRSRVARARGDLVEALRAADTA